MKISNLVQPMFSLNEQIFVNVIIEEGERKGRRKIVRYFLIDKIVITTNHRGLQFTLLLGLPFSSHLHYLLFNPFLSRGSINSACFSAIKFLPIVGRILFLTTIFFGRFVFFFFLSFLFTFISENRIFWTFFFNS